MNDEDYGSTEIECGRCGKRFSIELTRCPHCGASVYEPEYDNHLEENLSVEVPLGAAAKAVGSELLFRALLIVWWLISSFLGIILYFSLRLLFKGAAVIVLQVFAYISVAGGALVGGFLAGRFARRKPRLDGLLVGLLSLIGVILLMAWEFNDLVVGLVSWVTPFGLSLIVAAGWFGASIADRFARQAITEELFERPLQVADSDEHGLYYELLMKVNFEEETAERLIEYESRQKPDAKRVEWIEAAIQRWVRDNRV